jgi:hypothetical protein
MHRLLIATLALGLCLIAAPAAEAQTSEAAQLARRYLELARASDQLRASREAGAEHMAQAFRPKNAAEPDARAARLRDLIVEESAQSTAKILELMAQRLSTRLAVDDLRAIVRVMEAEPAVARLTAVLVDIQPDLVRLSTRETMAATARAMKRLKQEKPS